jgi:hypothetical protein
MKCLFFQNSSDYIPGYRQRIGEYCLREKVDIVSCCKSIRTIEIY